MRRCAGARHGVRLDSRQSSSTEVPMRLIGLAVVLVIGLTLTPLAGEAQQASKLYRIGDLVPGTAAATAPLIAVFRQALNGLGYVEGKNYVLEIRYSET